MEEEGTAHVVPEILIADPIPIRGASNAELLTEPVHIPPMVLGVLPKTERCHFKQPFLPIIVWKALLDRTNRRTAPMALQEAATMVLLEVIGR